ncbi:hypothetical protein D479_02987 [Halobacillus sp. BAB-2008]|nr:hypothetical protein D479_02987 [Halobacillus sp. BAB-2008]
MNLLDESTWEANFKPDSIDAVLAEHVWEHLTFEEGVRAAQLCRKFLKEGGYVRCAVPDGYFPNEEYQKIVQVGGPGPADHPAATHRIVHNYSSLTRLFEVAGFEVNLLEYCDEEGQFHANTWHGADGVIYRSKQFDSRNQGDQLGFPSLIMDAVRPSE